MASTVWKGHLSFGLISIPVRLYRAARPERVTLHQLRRAERDVEPPAEPAPARDDSRSKVLEMPAPAPARPPDLPAPELPAPVERVRQAAVTESGDQPVPQSEILKGYEVDPERWVVLDKSEIKALASKTSKIIDVLEFVRFGEIDPIYFETSYYLAPERAGEKAYALLYQALRDSGFAGLGRIAMHNREHILVIRPGRQGIIAHTMYFADEVRREEEPRADLSLVGDKELEVAVMFVKTLAAPFEPEKYKDTYRERLRELIEAKAQGRQVAVEAAAPPSTAPVGDLMEALQKSLALARKPVASEQPAQAAEAKPRKRGSRKG